MPRIRQRISKRLSNLFRPFSWSKKSFLDLLGLKTPLLLLICANLQLKRLNLIVNLHVVSPNGAFWLKFCLMVSKPIVLQSKLHICKLSGARENFCWKIFLVFCEYCLDHDGQNNFADTFVSRKTLKSLPFWFEISFQKPGRGQLKQLRLADNNNMS